MYACDRCNAFTSTSAALSEPKKSLLSRSQSTQTTRNPCRYSTPRLRLELRR